MAQLEEEKKHLEFMNQLKKYDQDLSPSVRLDLIFLLTFIIEPLSRCHFFLSLTPCFSPPHSHQDDKDSDSSRETLDDLFPDEQDEPGPGSKYPSSSVKASK